MKAVSFNQFGAASDVLAVSLQAAPKPQAGEVLVRMASSGVNPSDVKKRAGAFPDLLDYGPVIPHSDGAGVIEAVGEGVSEERLGERVFVYQAQHGRSMGTAADYVAIDSSRAPSLPAEASFAVGACIGIPIMTAHRCVTVDGPVGGLWVLVTGGAGRVGHYAIQWAKQFGARVLSTASNADDTEACYEAGAECVVNHRESGWGQQLLDYTNGQKIDRVIEVEFGANLSEVLSCIRVGGTIATYSSTVDPEPKLPFRTMMFMDLTIHLVIVYDMPETAKMTAIADTQDFLSEGKLVHRITHTLPLSETARAHELIESGTVRGCVILEHS